MRIGKLGEILEFNGVYSAIILVSYSVDHIG